MFFRLFFFVSYVSIASGFVQELTLYTEPGQGGDALRFKSKEPDLTTYLPHLRNVKSWCAKGLWHGFGSANYTNGRTINEFTMDGSTYCRNDTLFYTMSLRFAGPSETRKRSISIYRGLGCCYDGGMEYTFTGSSATNFGFLAKYIVLTGRSSWTGFENADFTGNSTCFSSSELIGHTTIYGKEIRSFVRGCDAKYKSEYVNVDKL
ncbi:hypothetical protein Fcan01_19313 [Folsomia candida]|uniref:Uncharacterized protein n=1 Tax=Folsomia candida TaxID=158441 RepID=A0A226DKK7_FOLCA|nr:hypothetical protein Fcan01_19313 [Folsomia candida]